MKRAITKEQINERKKEIIQAVNIMFDEMDYQDISMKTISEHISIARSSLYCYYNSKEEIMLDVLKEEYITFLNELISQIKQKNNLSENITDIYLKHIRLLKIISIHLTDIETHCSLSSLVSFKSSFVELFNELHQCFYNNFQNNKKEDIDTIINALLMLTHSLYPMIYPNENQINAMEKVGMDHCKDKYKYLNDYLNLIFSKLN